MPIIIFISESMGTMVIPWIINIVLDFFRNYPGKSVFYSVYLFENERAVRPINTSGRLWCLELKKDGHEVYEQGNKNSIFCGTYIKDDTFGSIPVDNWLFSY